MFTLAASAALPAIPDAKDHWAVLIAGSSGYGNYRHQSDVCHAYQVLKAGGVPADHIITLAVDDIANSRSNPFPGQMFNKPTATGTPGVDVYAGCKIDYSGNMVTPETFTKVLTGDSTGLNGGKVLKSSKTSKVFVNFVDHGGVNLIGFPKTTMHAAELEAALKQSSTAGLFDKLVFYLEACESGSMFSWLPKTNASNGLNIYATTASNAKESSWGTYCMPQDKVDGKEVGSCLGDLYSVNWMEDADKGTAKETLQSQFTKVQQLTTKSHVMQFGLTSIAADHTTEYEGNKDSVAVVGDDAADARRSSMASFEATLESAYRRALKGDENAVQELSEILQARMDAKRRFDRLSHAIAGVAADALPSHEGHSVACHYAAHKAYIANCGEYHPETIFYSATLASLCKHTKGDAMRVVNAVKAECPAEEVEVA